MNIPTNAPTRPALRYYGGKWRLAQWIISYFPPHQNYVEPCGGAASVLLQKPRSPLETYNDLNGDVVNFFRVLRDQPKELFERVRLTPWARGEYEYCLTPADDPLEKARRFFAAACMSFNGATLDSKATLGWRNTTDARNRSSAAWDIQNNDLMVIAERLIGVQIENRDWIEVVTRLDNDAALIYIDPPYVQEKRSKPSMYAFEWDRAQHVAAAELLHQCVGYVVVSGYACQLYAELYEGHGWHRVDREAGTNSGGTRTESLWLSPRCWATLNDQYDDLPMFAGEVPA